METPKRRRSLLGRAKDETDPQWKRFFLEVENRRKAMTEKKRRPVIVSTCEKDGIHTTIVWRKSDPELLKRLLKFQTKKAGSRIQDDLLWIRSAWPGVVGKVIATDSEVFAFKNGVLTVTVFSSILLQEMRQFHQEAILKDFRDIWQASVPLVSIKYRTGKSTATDKTKQDGLYD